MYAGIQRDVFVCRYVWRKRKRSRTKEGESIECVLLLIECVLLLIECVLLLIEIDKERKRV